MNPFIPDNPYRKFFHSGNLKKNFPETKRISRVLFLKKFFMKLPRLKLSFLRQRFLAIFGTLRGDNMATFSQPLAMYYGKVTNSFVRTADL